MIILPILISTSFCSLSLKFVRLYCLSLSLSLSISRKQLWGSFKRVEKVPEGKKSESPKACASWNWILESKSGSENLFQVDVGHGDNWV